MKITLFIIAALCVLSSVMPFVASKKWWVRGFDFPHLQLTVITCSTFILLCFVIDPKNLLEWMILVFLILAIIYQLVIIFPYTLFAKKEIASTSRYGKGTSFTKLKAHRLHFLKTNFLNKIRNYALERNDNYGTKSRIYL